MSTATITATILFETPYWVGIFERHDIQGIAAVRHVFGAEPTDPELYEFITQHYYKLKFSEPVADIKLIIKRKNPKRVLREVKKLMAKADDHKESLAQEIIRIELEKNRKLKKQKSSADKEAAKERQFSLKQAKKKKKQRGH